MDLSISSKYYNATLDLQVIDKSVYETWSDEQFQTIAESAEGIIIAIPNGVEVSLYFCSSIICLSNCIILDWLLQLYL